MYNWCESHPYQTADHPLSTHQTQLSDMCDHIHQSSKVHPQGMCHQDHMPPHMCLRLRGEVQGIFLLEKKNTMIGNHIKDIFSLSNENSRKVDPDNSTPENQGFTLYMLADIDLYFKINTDQRPPNMRLRSLGHLHP